VPCVLQQTKDSLTTVLLCMDWVQNISACNICL